MIITLPRIPVMQIDARQSIQYAMVKRLGQWPEIFRDQSRHSITLDSSSLQYRRTFSLYPLNASPRNGCNSFVKIRHVSRIFGYMLPSDYMLTVQSERSVVLERESATADVEWAESIYLIPGPDRQTIACTLISNGKARL